MTDSAARVLGADFAWPLWDESADEPFVLADPAARIEDAARSLLAQDYPRLRVVIVDDRSTDDTEAILDRLAAENAHKKCAGTLHSEEIPSKAAEPSSSALASHRGQHSKS